MIKMQINTFAIIVSLIIYNEQNMVHMDHIASIKTAFTAFLRFSEAPELTG